MTNLEEYESKIKRIIISREEIAEKTEEVGKEISRQYKGSPLLLISVLKGSYMFLADLSRAVTIPHKVGFMCAESYFGGTESVGKVNITMDIDCDISGYNVIIVEDIIDTGRTLKALTDILKARSPISLKIVTLLNKPERRTVELEADISLFTIPDIFVIGCGLDYDGYYRNLPFIAEYGQEP